MWVVRVIYDYGTAKSLIVKSATIMRPPENKNRAYIDVLDTELTKAQI